MALSEIAEAGNLGLVNGFVIRSPMADTITILRPNVGESRKPGFMDWVGWHCPRDMGFWISMF